ncbi:MAG TPA: hypothetical protein VF942_09385, partial [Acidimicrobiales bacterium]
MSALPRIALVSFLVALPLASGASAQDVVTGTPPFGTFQSFGPSVLNLANLNTQISIPLLSRPGRGTGFNYSLAYDNSVWVPDNATFSWQPRPQLGWHGLSEGVTGYLSYKVTTTGCPGPPPKPPGHLRILTNFVYHDARGVPHAFNGRAVVNVDFCGYSESLTDQLATDGSGYLLNYHPDHDGPTDVRTVTGTVINPPENDPGGSGSVMDPNGNVVSTTMSSSGGTLTGTFTDTLGTTALTVAGQAPSPVSLSYPDAGGTGRTITLQYESRTIKTNFGCATGIAEYSQDAQALLTRIVMPDQSSYAFTYEPTPGDASAVTGRMASITLPTGAVIRYAYTGDNNGIVCDDGSTAGVEITTADAGTWRYRRARSGNSWVTTATDPAGNETVSTFSGIYRTQMQAYAGPAGSTLLTAITTCYNASGSTCVPGDVVPPISSRMVVTTLDNNQVSVTRTVFNAAGQPLATFENDF